MGRQSGRENPFSGFSSSTTLKRINNMRKHQSADCHRDFKTITLDYKLATIHWSSNLIDNPLSIVTPVPIGIMDTFSRSQKQDNRMHMRSLPGYVKAWCGTIEDADHFKRHDFKKTISFAGNNY